MSLRKREFWRTLLGLSFCLVLVARGADKPKSVLIVVEGSSSLKNQAIGMGRQLGELLGHFNTATTIEGVNDYTPRQMENFDFTFYVGFHSQNPVPAKFTDDVLRNDRRVIWLDTGIREFCLRPGVAKKLGFTVNRIDSTSNFNIIRYNGKTFTKKELSVNIIELLPHSAASATATVYSSSTRKEHPYIVNTGLLTYIADSPFAYADEATEYLLFADMLHDILGELHEESHQALIRIEDVTPMEDPNKLRDIADILASRNIPFLVGVVPFYVNPAEGIRISLSDKPDLVDALKYMVQNGATIVMHGVTHQYRGVTAVDYEFWDESTNGVIKGETVKGIEQKLDLGIQEFMKNGLYPLIWETPHYTASFKLYETVARYFSTAMEQRLSMEDFDFSQFFPYVIHKDLFGQVIYPENLGYVPLDPDKNKTQAYVQHLIDEARDNLAVRDGFASCFFHAFVDHDFLKELVDSIQAMGYTYIDLREKTNWVKTKDRVILSGSQSYTITLDDQYLSEAYYAHDGEITNRIVSEQRLKGPVTKTIELEPGQFYRAEPTEFRERPVSFAEEVKHKLESVFEKVVGTAETWQQAKPIIFWNYHARGAAFNDQAALAAVFGSVNIPVDTLFVGQPVTSSLLNLQNYNLLIVPNAFVDSLGQDEYDVVKQFVEDGGCLITDGQNDLAEEMGIKFSESKLRVLRVRDRFFPEERIAWRYPQLTAKFEAADVDEVFCIDEDTEAPLAIGKTIGKGKMIFFSTQFDPQSQLGVSQYPYLLDYVRRYFRLGPIVRRNSLEVFFDPGLRKNLSIETLVKQWVSEGVRVVHVAGWHEYPKYTYDYARLIALAHGNGILVYAWLEPPQVSQMFWKAHPEWREKNYKGEDVQSSWRYPVALTDKRCVDTVVQHYKDFLERFDWDGVNLAELYFDSGPGLEDPIHYTPMHPSAREAIRRRYGFDPATVFDRESPYFWRTNPFVRSALADYRVAKLREVYIQILTMLKGVEGEKQGFGVVVTAMDSYGSPELRDWIGVDMTSILALQKEFGFGLSVEDPQHLWSTTPLRYVGIGRRYTQLVGDSSKLLLDLNIGSFRKPEEITMFPTIIQTGTESFQMMKSAAAGARRTVVYCEATINPQDMVFFPFAITAGVDIHEIGDGYDVDAPWSFDLQLPRDIVEVRIDGVPNAPARENNYLIPAGKHHIVLSTGHENLSSHELQPRIMGVTGNLEDVSYNQRVIRFTYTSGGRTLVSVNRSPEGILVDGQPYQSPIMKGNDCYTVFLPPGAHSVELVAGDQFSYGISWTSFWSSTVIAIFGTVAVGLLLVMYFVVVLIRRRYRTAGSTDL
ncbi:MAG: polysaccharide deacetylase family protein [Bacteroidota bacterium]